MLATLPAREGPPLPESARVEYELPGPSRVPQARARPSVNLTTSLVTRFAISDDGSETRPSGGFEVRLDAPVTDDRDAEALVLGA